MKVSINIKKHQLDELIYALKNELILNEAFTIPDKIYNHLFEGVLKKLLRKQIDRSDNYSAKLFKMTFSYPQAAALWHNASKVESSNLYRVTVCRQIQLQIHKQLV